eukprot:1266385-Amphidinium_carterae.1
MSFLGPKPLEEQNISHFRERGRSQEQRKQKRLIAMGKGCLNPKKCTGKDCPLADRSFHKGRRISDHCGPEVARSKDKEIVAGACNFVVQSLLAAPGVNMKRLE